MKGPKKELQSKTLKAWADLGTKVQFRNHKIHCFYQEGSDEALLVLLHGYPTSSFDFYPFIQLRGQNSILTFDFLGFGLSDKPATHDYSLLWQADLVEELVRRHNGSARPIVIVAHDMGTSVATELLARDLERKLSMKIAKVCLFNGNMLIDRGRFRFGQVLLRSWLGPFFARYFVFKRIFISQLGSIFSRAHPMTHEYGQAQWELLKMNGGHRIMDKVIQYTHERLLTRHGSRWSSALRDWKGELQLLWGMADPIATASNQLEGLRSLREGVNVLQLEKLGHYPHVENPEIFCQALDEFLQR